MRDTPGSMAWFGTYEYAKKEMMRMQGIDPATGTLSPLAVLTAGGLAGMACWTVAIPADVLKSRYQSAPEGTYTGIMDVYSQANCELECAWKRAASTCGCVPWFLKEYYNEHQESTSAVYRG